MRPTLHDDDEVAGLPASDGDAASETADSFEADVEGSEDEGDEDVGLDTEAGIDDPLEADLELQIDEGASLLHDSEAAEDLATGEDELAGAGDEEYGYTEDSEPLNDEGLYEGALALGDEGGALEDRGEEGFGDDAIASELDLDKLPPLDEGSDDDELDERAEQALARRASQPPRAERALAQRVRVEVLQRSGRPLRVLCAAGSTGIAWDGTLLVAGPNDPRPQRRYAGSEAAGAIAAIETGRGLEIALVTPEALLVSHDGGRTCSTRHDWPSRVPASTVALLRSPSGGVRLLAAAPMGGVHASDDGGPFRALGPEAGVVRLGSDGALGALALIRTADNHTLLALSTDGAATFDTMHAPVDALERVQDAQIAGQAVVCCRRAPEPKVVWTQAETWSELLHNAASPVRALEERHGTVVVYACVPSGERVAIVRRELPKSPHGDHGGSRPAEQIAELPRDVGVVLQLAAAHDGGITTLHVGTERAWLRITVLPGGGDA